MNKTILLAAALVLVPSCDKAKDPQAEATPAVKEAPPAPAPATVAKEAPAPAAAPAPAQAPKGLVADADGAGSRCDAPVRRADNILRTTGAPSLVAVLYTVEESIRKCEEQQWPAEVLACMQTSTDARTLLYDCYARAFADHPIEVKRRFHALADNTGVTPAAGTVDGDYIAIDDSCGAYTRLAPPAYGMYYLCGSEAQGPFMTPDDIQEFYAAMSASEELRHKIVMDLIDKTNVKGRRVDVYEDGVYKGSHPDF